MHQGRLRQAPFQKSAGVHAGGAVRREEHQVAFVLLGARYRAFFMHGPDGIVVLDPATRAVMVRAILPNPGARLKPGMLLQVSIRSAQRRGLAVPELAIVGEGEERFVYVIDKDGKARRTRVTTGLRDAGFIEVTGLEPGSRVVTEGVIKVTDGAKVRTEAPTAAPKPTAQAGG